MVTISEPIELSHSFATVLKFQSGGASIWIKKAGKKGKALKTCEINLSDEDIKVLAGRIA